MKDLIALLIIAVMASTAGYFIVRGRSDTMSRRQLRKTERDWKIGGGR